MENSLSQLAWEAGILRYFFARRAKQNLELLEEINSKFSEYQEEGVENS